jgi:hypothetical protein
VAKTHTNYQISMVVENILEITNLDAGAALYTKSGKLIRGLTLCHVLLAKFKLKDGFQLIAEVHQSAAPMSSFQVVVPQTPEAKKMVLMMNKNFPAFLTFVLQDFHFLELAIQEYVKPCCCQVKAAEIKVTTLTMPQDLNHGQFHFGILV